MPLKSLVIAQVKINLLIRVEELFAFNFVFSFLFSYFFLSHIDCKNLKRCCFENTTTSSFVTFFSKKL